jgi:hypothetical protein
MKNYAIEYGRKFFLYYEPAEDVYKIEDIADTGRKFEIYGEWMCNGKLTHATLKDCIESLNGSRKPVIYHGENINVWVPDIFLSVNRYTGEVWREYHFDDAILRRLETVA